MSQAQEYCQTFADLVRYLEDKLDWPLLDPAFGELNLHRVQLTVFAYNERAIALYEKLGFVREGVYREFMACDGVRYDMYLYGLLRREWEAR